MFFLITKEILPFKKILNTILGFSFKRGLLAVWVILVDFKSLLLWNCSLQNILFSLVVRTLFSGFILLLELGIQKMWLFFPFRRDLEGDTQWAVVVKMETKLLLNWLPGPSQGPILGQTPIPAREVLFPIGFMQPVTKPVLILEQHQLYLKDGEAGT